MCLDRTAVDRLKKNEYDIHDEVKVLLCAEYKAAANLPPGNAGKYRFSDPVAA